MAQNSPYDAAVGAFGVIRNVAWFCFNSYACFTLSVYTKSIVIYFSLRMSNGIVSHETGREQPEPEELTPETLALIARFLDELGPGGTNAVKNIRLAEHDLRVVAATDTRFIHALDRADQLAQVRVALEKIFGLAADTTDALAKPIAGLRSLGGQALDRVPIARQNKKES